jgi:predicted ATPase
MAEGDPLRPAGRDAAAGRRGSTFHVLVTGPSGVGKSFMAAALHRRGYATYDSDAVPGLAGWYTADGHAVAWPDGLAKTSCVHTGSCGTPPD